MNIQVCRDPSDAVALYLPQRLYLKSFAKLNISVQLPTLKVHGKAISNWELMEKLRKMIQPESFSILKVSKHTTEVIRFDAEIEHRDKLDRVISRLEDRVVQLNDFPEQLRVKVSEAKSDYPSRHSWDSFFRDAADMDEMKPGERPDSVHISNLPIRWFVHDRDRDADAPPSESIVKKVFEKFGSIRQVDVPAADPYRMQMKSSMRGITTPAADTALYFEGYIQFSEYVGFVRCMDSLRGCKLLRKKDDIAEWCGIKVDFDKTKHMTDAAVKRRSIVRERLMTRQRARNEEENAEKDKKAKREARERQKKTVSRIILHSLRQKHQRVEKEKLERMHEREEKRKRKQLAKLQKRDGVDVSSAVAEEERRLLKMQKKLQAMRLLEDLFNRIELRPQSDRNARPPRPGDAAARARMIERMKQRQQQTMDAQRERVQQAKDGRIVIRSALETKKPKSKPRDRHSSRSASSGDDRARGERERQKRIKTEKLSTPEREIEYKKTLGMYASMAQYGFGFPFAHPGFAAGLQPGMPHPAYAQNMAPMFFPPAQGGPFYPPPGEYGPRRGWRGRGWRGRGGPRGGARFDPETQYYNRYGNKDGQHGEHDDRRSRSRSRSRRRSYTRSRSRSRSRHRSRSRRRSYSRSRRTRSRSSRSRHSRSRSRRSRSHRRSHSRSKSKSKAKQRSPTPDKRSTPPAAERRASVDSNKFVSPKTMRARRSKSWSLPKEAAGKDKSWSKSPKDK